MRILYGICGLGSGHATRAQALLHWLAQRGHQVFLLTQGTSTLICQQLFPELPRWEVAMPWMPSSSHGLLFDEIATIDKNNHYHWARNFAAVARCRDCLAGYPELVLTDYEPFAASVAYSLDVPLITMDQQSKFLCFQTPNLDGYTRREEASRLQLFFPAANQRIISSFAELSGYARDARFPALSVPPILSERLRRCKLSDRSNSASKPSIVVYMSPFAAFTQSVLAVVEILRGFTSHRFFLFCKDVLTEQQLAPNVSGLPLQRERFIMELSQSVGVISSAGHQLISEAIYLGKPMLLIPFQTYEQQFNAHMLNLLTLGIKASSFSKESVSNFIAYISSCPRRQEPSWVSEDSCDGTQVFDFLMGSYGL